MNDIATTLQFGRLGNPMMSYVDIDAVGGVNRYQILDTYVRLGAQKFLQNAFSTSKELLLA